MLGTVLSTYDFPPDYSLREDGLLSSRRRITLFEKTDYSLREDVFEYFPREENRRLQPINYCMGTKALSVHNSVASISAETTAFLEGPSDGDVSNVRSMFNNATLKVNAKNSRTLLTFTAKEGNLSMVVLLL